MLQSQVHVSVAFSHFCTPIGGFRVFLEKTLYLHLRVHKLFLTLEKPIHPRSHGQSGLRR